MMVKWKILLASSLVVGTVLASGCAKKADETTPSMTDSTSMAPYDSVPPMDTTSRSSITTTTDGNTTVTTRKSTRTTRNPTAVVRGPSDHHHHSTPAVPVSDEKLRPIMVPAGTTINVAIGDDITTKTAKEGDSFSGRLTEDVVVDGRTAFPKGATVEGHVVSAMRGGGNESKRAHLQLKYDRVVVEGIATALNVTGADIEGQSGTKGDVTRIGGGAAAGAAAGAILGGSKGAAKGAIVGGVAGTAASLLAHAPDVVIEAGSTQSVRLNHTVMVGERAVEAANR